MTMSLLFLHFVTCGLLLGVANCQNSTHCETEAKADILFIMDSTGSIEQVNYDKMLRFIANLTHTFTLGPDAIQFGAIMFSAAAQPLFNFGQFNDHQRLEQAILAAPWLQGTTNTDAALKYARLQSFTAAGGARPGVTRIAIVLTDGGSVSKPATASEAKLLKDNGVLVFSIGIGNQIDQVELQTIATSPEDVFTVNNFNILDTITKKVTNKTCEQVVNPPKQVQVCDAQADILFLLASSARANQADYNKILNFVANITRGFNIGPNAVQFATIVFGNNSANLLFDFSKHSDYPALEASIFRTPYLGGGTSLSTELALELAWQQAFTKSHGARQGVHWIAMIITDGPSFQPDQAVRQARLLKNSDVEIHAIGIGNVNRTELQAISSIPVDVLTVSTYDSLSMVQEEVTNKTCEEVTASRSENTTCNITQQADILFILDSSGSIGQENYNLMLSFVANITRNFNIGPDAVQFAAIIFSSATQEVFDFKRYTSSADIEKGILGTQYVSGSTATATALQMAREQMLTPAKGARSGVPKIVIVFTDGGSDNKNQTAEQAKQLIASGALVMSVGIGSGVNQQELLNIASAPENVFTVSNFDVLNNIQREITHKTCEIVITSPHVDAAACNADADILLIMESSSSILANNYDKMLNFVVNLTKNFNIGPKAVQFATVIFGDDAREVFDFTKYTDHAALEKGLLATPYLQGDAYTNKALQLAREQIFTAAKGSRQNVPKIAIVLTDGQSTKPTDTVTQSRLLKTSGVLVVSIGIGNSVNQQELETIASLPHDVFQVTNFDVLDTIQKEVANKTCERVTEEMPNCPAVADILFIVDSTGSIGEENYKKMLMFIANFTRQFSIGPNWVQFSGITFGDTAHNEFTFNTYNTHAALEKGILSSKYFGETTQTDVALKMARELSFTSENGARPEVDKIAIVLTDGRSNNPDLTAQQAKLLKESGVLVLTVAIGVDILNSELESIATLPEDVFHVDHFDTLESIEQEFFKQTCDRVTQTIECEAQADILFIVDSSSNIQTGNYNKILHFLVNLTQHFDLGPNAVQFSTIIFGDDAHLEFDFGQYNNHQSLQEALLQTRYLAQKTYTSQALLLARLEAFTAAHGARGNVSKIAIVITDGLSSLPTETTREAQLLKDTGVLVLSVGIGDSVKLSELQTIATLPTDVFHVDNFNVLNSIQKALTNKTCEKVTSSQVSACSKLADVIFLLDSSGSVSSEDYRTQLTFAANFTDNFKVGANDARFGAVIFSDNATKLFDLDDYSDHWSILQSLLAAPHLKGGTNTAEAIEMIIREKLFDAQSGGRNNAIKMLVIMTDGQSENVTQSIAAAQQLKKLGVQIMAIGVGDIVNIAELQGIATSPEDVFQAANYEVLSQLQSEVTNHTCGFIKPPTSVIHYACSEMADIIFVIDSSTSISSEEYQTQLLFISNLTQEFEIGPVDALFAAVVFSNDVFKVFDLEAFSDHFSLYKELLRSPHLTGTTDIGKALNWIYDMGMFGTAFGGRANASKIVVLFTDNASSDPPEALNAAERLKKDQVHITVVGINNYDLFEIRQLASSELSAFKATSVDALDWIQRNIVDDICDYASTGPYKQ